MGIYQGQVEEPADDDEWFGGGVEEILAGGETDLLSFIRLGAYLLLFSYKVRACKIWFVNQSGWGNFNNWPDGVVGYHVSLTPLRSWDWAPVWSLFFFFFSFLSFFFFFFFFFPIFIYLLVNSMKVNSNINFVTSHYAQNQIHTYCAIPIAPKLINSTIKTFTALLSNRSLPLSTQRLSCSVSFVWPTDVPTDDLMPFSAAALATVSVWRRWRLSSVPRERRPEEVSAVPPGWEEEGWMRTYTDLISIILGYDSSSMRQYIPSSPYNTSL